MNVTIDEIIQALDGADVFLRDRATSIPAPLNEYDIMELLEIANVCNEATSIIKHQKEENKNLKASLEQLKLRHDNAKAETEQWKEEANRYQNLWCEAQKTIYNSRIYYP